MTETSSDENLKRFIMYTISHPPTRQMISKWNKGNPERGIPCTHCANKHYSCRSLSTRLNCSSRSCSMNGEPCSRINEELFDRVREAWSHVSRTEFDAVLKEIRAEEPPRETSRLLPNSEMDVGSMSTPSSGAGSADVPEVTPVTALPGCAEGIASPGEALILGDPFANLPIGLPTWGTPISEQSPQSNAPMPERGGSDPGSTSSMLPRYSYYQASCYVPSLSSTGRYSYSPFAPLPSTSAAPSEATANAAAELEQRILALIAQKDAAVATNAENAERIRLLETATIELQVVLDEKNELQSHLDVLQADNATLRLEKESLCTERDALLEINNSYHTQIEALKGEVEISHRIEENSNGARSDAVLQDLDKPTGQYATLYEDLSALEKHAKALQIENDEADAKVAELEERFKSESAQRNVLELRTVDFEAKIKTIEEDSVRLLETIRELQLRNELASSADEDHRKELINELESSNTQLSNSLQSQERKLRATRSQNLKHQRSIVFQHLAISKLRDKLASAYRVARAKSNPLCGVVSRHLAELGKLEMWLLEQTPKTYDEIVRLWATDEEEAANPNDGASRARKRQRGVD